MNATNAVIRISSTTAMFITGLARILREEFELPIYQHEHWTLRHVAHWVECGQSGNCSDHGMSKKYQRKIDQAIAVGGSMLGASLELVWCYPYVSDVYVGTGQALMTYEGNNNKVKLRTRITKLYSDVMGTMYAAEVWALKPDGNLVSGKFYLHDNGTVSPATYEEASPYPPSGISFWKESDQDSEVTPV